MQYLCTRFPQLIVERDRAGKTARSSACVLDGSIIDILLKVECIYNLGLVPDSPIETAVMDSDNLNQINHKVMGEIMRFQFLNYQRANKIIAALKYVVERRYFSLLGRDCAGT